jgi:hypothetical protein
MLHRLHILSIFPLMSFSEFGRLIQIYFGFGRAGFTFFSYLNWFEELDVVFMKRVPYRATFTVSDNRNLLLNFLSIIVVILSDCIF